jgi:leader peptidase (prepilin peptidase) / N-methyltransferase
MTGLDIAVLVLVGMLGLVVGSALTVVVPRVPRGESLVHPPSACPACGHRIRARDSVPVLSWLLLRRRCRDCGAPISRRYPAVELATAGLFVLVAAAIGGAAGLPWAVPAFLYLAAISVALALIDVDTHTLPNRIVLPAYPISLALLALASAGEADWGAFVRALAGGAILFVFYFGLAMVYPSGMGFGDVKLAGVLGLYLGWLGWGALVVGAFGAFVLGGIYSIILLAAGRVGRKSGIPFGPWMLAGAGVGALFGSAVWHRYLALIGLA